LPELWPSPAAATNQPGRPDARQADTRPSRTRSSRVRPSGPGARCPSTSREPRRCWAASRP